MKDSDGLPLNVADYTADAQIRKFYTSSNAILFNTTLNSDSSLTLTLDPEDTVDVEPGRYVYDVKLTHGSGIILRILEGIATITPDVTR